MRCQLECQVGEQEHLQLGGTSKQTHLKWKQAEPAHIHQPEQRAFCSCTPHLPALTEACPLFSQRL